METASNKRISVDYYRITKLGEDMMKLLPPTTKHMSLLKVYMKGCPTVKEFGMPFANRGHPSHGFLNHDGTIKGHTLVSILEQDSFQFIVAAPDKVLEHRWAFDNDNEHLATLTQSQVQDIMRVHKAAVEISATCSGLTSSQPEAVPQKSAISSTSLYHLVRNSWTNTRRPGAA
ncbi:hypothetical protein THARTR1_02744 [Trichoderma harzianum]|uniref:Uncharacterized protein n=1 Tax=Trichoderma harzianum TaxID=5544 RepID=A0A2K0UHF4_TRIHA|nr:hypothetical protein THARTR1_02744 [Trichoderma harzianum]